MTPLPAKVFLAQTEQSTPSTGSPVVEIVGLLIAVLMIAATWKIFTKAGQPGWACLIPIYNIYILCKIVGRPGWWVILALIPFVGFIILYILCKIVGRPDWWVILALIPSVGFIIGIILCIDLAKCFGNGVGFGLGLAFLGIIFFPILGFGSSQYQGPVAGEI